LRATRNDLVETADDALGVKDLKIRFNAQAQRIAFR
jgi:hypothetical protein